ncbi:MAG: hypothetical protein JWO07_713 [Candidatus Saccharibacteria bacterium]|nr:hypothetical protein [Candidatus Saccharibacteria bacterium]
MEQSKNSSRRMLYIGIAVVIAVVVAIIVVAIAMLGTTKNQTASTTTTPAASKVVASKDDVNQSLAQLDATMKQATADQAVAKAALKDSTNQIKVGN